jgi:rhamnosyltransferase
MRELHSEERVLGEAQVSPETVEPSGRFSVCAVIVTYNIGEAVRVCYDAIQNQVDHVVIVDNGSSEPTRRELNRIAASDSVTLILNQRNEGIARAFNQSVEWARSKGFRWILTLDHDSEATPRMVDKLFEAFALLEKRGVEHVAVVGANPYDINARFFITRCPPTGSGDVPVEEGEVISSGSLIDSRVFDAIGPFNEELFVHYVDIDFCVRLARGGFRVYLCPDAVLLHQEGTKERMRFLWRHALYDRYSKEARYYLTRNSIYLMKRYHPLDPGIVHWILERLWKDHIKILLFDPERFSLFWFSLRGFIDGLRGKVGALNFENSQAQRAD